MPLTSGSWFIFGWEDAPSRIDGGFTSSEERTLGGTLTPQTVIITGGYRATEERSFGGGISAVTLNTALQVAFPTPVEQLVSGAGLQEFRVQLRKRGTGTNPTVSLELWYFNGTTRSKLSDLLTTSAVTSSTGEIKSVTWNASLLPDLTGEGVELKIVGSGASGGTVEIGAAEWNYTGFTPQFVGGYLRSEERSFGGRLTGATQNVTGGYVASDEIGFGGTLSIPFFQGGFSGGELAPGDYPPTDLPLPIEEERTFGGSITMVEDTRIRVGPSTLLALVGLSGDITDIQDDPDQPDNSWLLVSG